MGLAYRLSQRAEEDIVSISAYTLRNFGEAALNRYLRLIECALLTLCDDSGHVHVREFENGIFRFHLSHCREIAVTESGVVKAPRHVIFFRQGDDNTLEVVRLLHDSMDFGRHLDDE